MKPAISEAETQVMEVLWAASTPVAADAVATRLQDRTDGQQSTEKSSLGRWVSKGGVPAMPDVRRFLYAPLLQRQDWLAEQSTGLLDRLFGGRLAPLVAQFASTRRLSREDRAALEQLLKEQGDD